MTHISKDFKLSLKTNHLGNFMSRKLTEMAYANLGEYLRDTRINLGVDLVTVAEETKISSKSLQAMEENNFANLPAEAFARGFYALYAKSLALDGEEVLKMYMQQKPKQHKSGAQLSLPRTKLAQEVETMAERPAFKPLSFFGLVLLLLLFFGGFLCWYFSWNPATYLSQKLRSLEQPHRIEQVSANRTEPNHPEPNLSFTRLFSSHSDTSDLFGLSYPTIATAAIAHDMPKDPAYPFLQSSNFYTTADSGTAAKTRSPNTGKKFTAIESSEQSQQ
jgi:cytoskeletal protein RodZ